jgi:hypothetical protein
MENKKANGYTYSKQWFEFTFENPDKITPAHTALYLWTVELNNRLGWKEKFGLPTDYSMLAIGIRNRRTYYKALNDLVEWGFVEMLTKSKNQHTASIIALSSACVKNAQASPRHIHKQVPGTAPIDKHIKQEETIKTNINPKEADSNFLIFDFQEEYKIANGITYVLKEEDYSAARQLSEIYKNETGITDEEELRTSLKEYFKVVIRHPEDFHRTRMDLSYLVKNINRINNSLQNGSKGTGVTIAQLANLISKKDFSSENIPSMINIIKSPPSIEEVIKHFEEVGSTKVKAEKFYDSCAYVKQWKDNAGFSFVEKWKDYATNYINNKKQ